MKQDQLVELILLSTITPIEKRKAQWEKVEGKLVMDVEMGLSIYIERTEPNPHQFFMTSHIDKVEKKDDGTYTIQTRNSVYHLKVLEKTGENAYKATSGAQNEITK